MRELWEILAHITEITEEGRKAALATVIATSGSTYRRPGARMLITPEEAVGAVSAGCLEDEIRAVGLRVIRTGNPERLRFDTTEEMDKIAGTGLGCRGTIDVFVEPLSPERAHPYLALCKALEEDRVCTLGIEIPAGRRILLLNSEPAFDELRDPPLRERIASVREQLSPRRPTALLPLEDREIYVERIEPPLKLIVFGAGYDAQPLVRLAKELGFRVTVMDPRPQYLTEERFPEADRLVLAHPSEAPTRVPVDERTFLVILTHNYLYDLELLKWALRTEAPYVGQIGPRARTEELLADIERERGLLLEEARGKLYGPVGLDVGAESPEEIALSILSEILAVRSGRAGGFLRERQGPIHTDG
jgi:xanthine/CO dehydrogenase XdhC/CoxF family maturation factor